MRSTHVRYIIYAPRASDRLYLNNNGQSNICLSNPYTPFPEFFTLVHWSLVFQSRIFSRPIKALQKSFVEKLRALRNEQTLGVPMAKVS